MNHLISVIVPVYNVESYLERCIDSIINQTYTNLEIILVNDGSTDNSKIICDSYAKKDERVIVIDQKNSGSSIARNSGLNRASGDIISFIDSDDFIEPVMYSKMLELLINHNLEVIEIAPKSTAKQLVYDNSFIIEDTISATKRIITNTCFSVWRRIYKKELVQEMRFIPNIIHQDVFYTIDVLKKINKIGYLNTPLYNYNNEGISVIRSKYSAHKRDIAIKATEYIKTNVPDDPEINKVVNNYIASYYTDHYFLLSRNTAVDKDKTYRLKLKKEILKATNFSNLKLRSFLVLCFPIKFMEFISSKSQTLKTKLN